VPRTLAAADGARRAAPVRISRRCSRAFRARATAKSVCGEPFTITRPQAMGLPAVKFSLEEAAPSTSKLKDHDGPNPRVCDKQRPPPRRAAGQRDDQVNLRVERAPGVKQVNREGTKHDGRTMAKRGPCSAHLQTRSPTRFQAPSREEMGREDTPQPCFVRVRGSSGQGGLGAGL